MKLHLLAAAALATVLAAPALADQLEYRALIQERDVGYLKLDRQGQKVAVDYNIKQNGRGPTITEAVTLDKDVDGITLKVFDSKGNLVRTGQIGAQKKGDYPFTWDGLDNNGEEAANGVYRIEASVTRFGVSSKAAVSTMAQVRSVTTDATTNDMKVELDDGTQVSMSEVKRIGN